MNTLETIYEKWQEEFWDKLDPPEIEDTYKFFRTVISFLEDDERAEIWDAMTMCQTAAAKVAFKEGYKMGFRLHDEMR